MINKDNNDCSYFYSFANIGKKYHFATKKPKFFIFSVSL